MIKYSIKSIPIDEVISELAGLMNTEILKSCDECTINIPEELGSGYIKGVVFEKGMGFINYNCTFNDDVQINFLRNKIHPLKFLYVLEGKMEHIFEDSQRIETLEQFQYCVLAGKSSLAHSINFKKDENLAFNSLEINRIDFNKAMSCSIEKMKPKIRMVLNDLEAKNAYYHKGFYYLEISDLFQQIKDFEGNNGFRKIFMEGIVHQMLITQLIEFHSEINGESDGQIMKKHEVKSIEEAQEIISNELEKLPSIKQLGYRVGLNSNKLQSGFRRMHGSSVNGYIREKRLEISRDLLLESQLNMAEISEKIGISSKSYFSKLFKENYNLTPYEFRKKYSKGSV